MSLPGVMQGKAGMESYRQFEADRDRGDFEGLPELHATLSGMKVSCGVMLMGSA